MHGGGQPPVHSKADSQWSHLVIALIKFYNYCSSRQEPHDNDFATEAPSRHSTHAPSRMWRERSLVHTHPATAASISLRRGARFYAELARKGEKV